ncbi:Platelet glycoprotein Ib beta chain [Aix galericulata]|nr:Platelet glycoprotein Ib beta chain [Aix galericulata]
MGKRSTQGKPLQSALLLPQRAEIINLAHNSLTSIPNGLFDNLKNLQIVYLQGNPWECNCDILYLRSWLQWQQNRTFYRDC